MEEIETQQSQGRDGHSRSKSSTKILSHSSQENENQARDNRTNPESQTDDTESGDGTGSSNGHDSQPGPPSQQPGSQQAHVEPAYYPLNPWYGQPSGRGPTFSLGWPLPRTVRPGMLNNLRPEVLAELPLQKMQTVPERPKQSYDPEEGKGITGQRSRSIASAQQPPSSKDSQVFPSQRTNAYNSSYHSDVRDQDHQPIPRVKPQDRVDQVEDTPPDPRPESMLASTRVMPHNEETDGVGEVAARKAQSQTGSCSLETQKSSSSTSLQAGRSLDKMTTEASRTSKGMEQQMRKQDHSEPDQEQKPSARELRNRWATIRARAPEPLAEFVATAIAIYIGLAANLSKTTSNNEYGNFLTQALAWGLGNM